MARLQVLRLPGTNAAGLERFALVLDQIDPALSKALVEVPAWRTKLEDLPSTSAVTPMVTDAATAISPIEHFRVQCGAEAMLLAEDTVEVV